MQPAVWHLQHRSPVFHPTLLMLLKVSYILLSVGSSCRWRASENPNKLFWSPVFLITFSVSRLKAEINPHSNKHRRDQRTVRKRAMFVMENVSPPLEFLCVVLQKPAVSDSVKSITEAVFGVIVWEGSLWRGLSLPSSVSLSRARLLSLCLAHLPRVSTQSESCKSLSLFFTCANFRLHQKGLQTPDMLIFFFVFHWS